MKKLVALAIAGYAFNVSAMDWIEQAQSACRSAKQSAPQCETSTAFVRRAMEAVRANGGNGSNGGHSPLEAAARSVAAYVVLEALYPEQQPEFENRLAIALANVPESQAKAEALARGRQVATEMLQKR
jgi:hypothetical protein